MFWPFLMIILAPNSFSVCAVPNIHVKLLNPSLSIIIGREVLKNWTERKHVKTIDKLNYASVFTDVIKSSVYDLCSLSVSFLPRAQIPHSPFPFPRLTPATQATRHWFVTNLWTRMTANSTYSLCDDMSWGRDRFSFTQIAPSFHCKY